MEQFSVPWMSVHFSACQYPINFTYRKRSGVLQISKMAGDQNVALMLMEN